MKRTKLRLLFAVLLVGFPGPAASAWVTEVVDRSISGGNGGQGSSIAVDSNGAIHISSINETTHSLQYTTNAEGGWVTTALNAYPYYQDANTSIAVDSMDKVHIAYKALGGLKYATNASGEWVVTLVDPDIFWPPGLACSIAVDSNDKVHISHARSIMIDATKLDLRYATNVSGGWTVTTLVPDTGGWNSIAVDGSDKVHISCSSEVQAGVYDLMHATKASGLWVLEAVAADYGGGTHVIAADGSNNAHIFYGLNYATNASGVWETTALALSPTDVALDSSDNLHLCGRNAAGIQHATNASGSWTMETAAYGSGEPSIALDRVDRVHISYVRYDYVHPTLEYATNASGPWVTTTLPSPGDLGSGTSVVVDDSERVHISYIDETNESLKYATNASGAWVTETVCPADRFGHTSIALDGSGNVHISHPGNVLEYTTNVSGAWVTETVDSSRGYFSSIALDSAGKAHISYGNNKYATNASGVWTTEALGEEFPFEGYPSIAVDSADQVHIAYLDLTDTARIVKYARKVSDTWVTEIVESAQDPFSMVLDSSDKAHIACRAWSEDDDFLRYATNVSGAWVTETLERGLFFSGEAWIALDSSDKVYIGYTGSTGPLPPLLGDAALKVAANASGRWETWVACDDLGSGQDGSIAVGRSGTVYVSHHSSSSLLLTSGIPPASSGWGPASTVESESRGDSAAPNYLLLLPAPVGIILLRKALKGRRGLSR